MNARLTRLDDNGLARRLRELTGGLSPQSVGRARAIRSVEGSVSFDSGIDTLDAIRSAGVLDGRQLVIAADDVVVALDLIARDGIYVVTGHVSGVAGPVAVQFLDEHGREVGLGTTDEHDEFEVDVEVEPVVLVLAGANTEITVDLSRSASGD